MNMLRNLYAFGAMLFLLALSSNAHAGLCPGNGITVYVANGAGSTLVVDPNAPNGTVLASWDSTVSGQISPGSGNCISATTSMAFSGLDTLGASNIYRDLIPGVGYRIRLTGGTCTTGYFPLSCTGRFGPGVSNIGLRIELIKTGRITPATVWNTPFGRMTDSYIYPGHNSEFATFVLLGELTVKLLQPPTCSVASKGPIKAPLGTVAAGSFKGVGSTSSARPFSIDLNCSGGNAGMSAAVKVTLTDATNTGNRSQVLTLSPDSQAKGLGIEILKGTTVLGYGPDSSAAGTVNQWQAGSVSTGTATFSIPLTARYVQTESAVTIGSANGRATFTMSYQ